MCSSCEQARKEADAQAKWLSSFGIRPEADPEYRRIYLERLVRCPEEEQVRGPGGSGGDAH